MKTIIKISYFLLILFIAIIWFQNNGYSKKYKLFNDLLNSQSLFNRSKIEGKNTHSIRSFPKKITELDEVRHMLTRACNLRCIHCYTPPVKGEKSRVFDLAIAQDFYLRYRPKVVSATGGEPLLKYEQVKIIAQCIAQYGGALELVTNGLLLTEEKVRELNELNQKTFYQISLDGTQEYHDYLRNKPGAFKAALKAIDIASQSGRLTKVRMTVTDENLDQIPQVVQLLDSFRRSNIMLVMRPVVLVGRADSNGLSFDFSQVKMLDNFSQQARFISVQTTDNMGKCTCGIRTIAIDPAGGIYPCNYFLGRPEYKMGNFYEATTLEQCAEFAEYTGVCFARKKGTLDTSV